MSRTGSGPPEASAPSGPPEAVDGEAAHGRHPGGGPAVEQGPEDLGGGNGTVKKKGLAAEPAPQPFDSDLVTHQEAVETVDPVMDGGGRSGGRSLGAPLGRTSVPGKQRQAGLHPASVSGSAVAADPGPAEALFRCTPAVLWPR